MRTKNGLTIIELLIVIAIIAVLITILVPITTHPHPLSKGAVCLRNMMALTKSWCMYTDENKGDLIGGDIGQTEIDWIPKPVVSDPTDIEGQKTNMQNGKLWPYVKYIESYHCPADKRLDDDGPYLSYSIIGGLNGQDRYEEDTRNYNVATKYDQVEFPEEKIVFVEEDAEVGWNPRSWQIYDPQDQTKWTWQDPIALDRHRGCSMYSFADGHAEKYNWQDERTLAMSAPPAEPGTMSGHTVGHVEQKENPDLLWMKKGYACLPKEK